MTALAPAAFLRVEQLLLPASDLQAALHLALRAPGTAERAARLGFLGVGLPALAVLGRADRRLRRRLLGLACRGLSRDRVELLLRGHWERHLAGQLRPQGLALVERARAEGKRLVLVSSSLAGVIAPLAERLGAELGSGTDHGAAVEVLADGLEWRDDVATGRVLEALPPGGVGPWAAARGIALSGSYAWGSDLSDAPLLRAVGWPCAVDPDAALHGLAEAEGWPVLLSEQAPLPGQRPVGSV